MSRLAEARLALMLLSRLPAGRLPEPAPRFADAAWAFPLAGLAVGVVAAAVMSLALAAGLPATVAAGLALATQIALTGGLHEDGIADLCDGFWGGYDRARRLEIMRDSRIGSYGALGIVLSVGLRWAALAAVPEPATALIVAAMASRVAPVALMAWLEPARADGLGHAAASVDGLRVAAAFVIGLVPLVVFAQGFAAAVLAALAVTALALMAKARIGGQTGDVLGASQQIAEIAVLITLCAR